MTYTESKQVKIGTIVGHVTGGPLMAVIGIEMTPKTGQEAEGFENFRPLEFDVEWYGEIDECFKQHRFRYECLNIVKETEKDCDTGNAFDDGDARH